MQVVAKVLQNKPDDLFTLSVSKSKTFEQCKAKYKFCYIEKLPRKEFDFHVFGKFLHEVLELFHAKLIEDSTLDYLPLLEELWNICLEKWKSQLNAEQIIEAKQILDEYKAFLAEEGLPNVSTVEKPFYIDINGKVLLNGFIDRVQVDNDGMIHVIDYKTTKNKKYLKDFFQLKTYAYVLMLENQDIKRVRASFVLLRHGFDFLTKEYTRQDAQEIEQVFLKYASDIEEERLWRASPQFLCKYCDYVDTCAEGQRFLIKRGAWEQPKTKSTDFGLCRW